MRRLSDEDVRAIFESLHGSHLPPPHLKFHIVPVGADGLKLSPPSYEFEGEFCLVCLYGLGLQNGGDGMNAIVAFLTNARNDLLQIQMGSTFCFDQRNDESSTGQLQKPCEQGRRMQVAMFLVI